MRKTALLLSLFWSLMTLSSCFLITDREVVRFGDETLTREELAVIQIDGESRFSLSRDSYSSEASALTYNALLHALHSGAESITLILTEKEYDEVNGNLDNILSDMFVESVMLPANNIPEEIWYHQYNALTGTFVLDIPPQIAAESVRYLTQYQEALEKARDISETLVPPGTDAYQAAYIFYQYIITHTDYTQYRTGESETSACTAWDALTQNKAQCEGFAKAFAMLASLQGIECAVITSDGVKDLPGHAWNLVKLEGEYYYIDCTNASQTDPNAPEGMNDYGFCMSSAYMQTVSSYDYNPAQSPAFGASVRHREVLPSNTGSRLAESPFYSPDADIVFGNADAVRTAFAESLEEGRNWIWVTGRYDSFFSAGLFEETENGGLLQSVSDNLPQDAVLSWEWTDTVTLLYLAENDAA